MDPVQWRNKLESTTEFGSTNESGLETHIHHGTAISIPTLLFALFWTLYTLYISYIYTQLNLTALDRQRSVIVKGHVPISHSIYTYLTCLEHLQDVVQRGYKHRTSLSTLHHAACTEPNLPASLSIHLSLDPYPSLNSLPQSRLTPSPDYL